MKSDMFNSNFVCIFVNTKLRFIFTFVQQLFISSRLRFAYSAASTSNGARQNAEKSLGTKLIELLSVLVIPKVRTPN